MLRKRESGFTLIELMIVVAIIGILVAMAIPKFGQLVERAKERKAVEAAKAAGTYTPKPTPAAPAPTPPRRTMTTEELEQYNIEREKLARQIYAVMVAANGYGHVRTDTYEEYRDAAYKAAEAFLSR